MAEWLARSSAGETVVAIAASEGVHHKVVAKYLRWAGGTRLSKEPAPAEVVSTWPDRYEAGEMLWQIARSCGVSQSTVSFHLKRLGVTGRRGKKHVPLQASDLLHILPDGRRVIRVPLTRGHFALVDESDAARVLQKKWTAMEGSTGVYAVHHFREQTADGFRLTHIRLHRFLMEPPEGMVVDHIDHDGLNCTRANMRVCTLQQNVFNSRAGILKLGRKGVWRQRGGTWVASIRASGKRLYLGSFGTMAEAQKAYDVAAIQHFGEYACLNFPNENERSDGNPALATNSDLSLSFVSPHPAPFAETQHTDGSK
jgi:hypothetical protein